MKPSPVKLLDRITARPRVVFVNLVNELMIAKAPADYARRMAIVTPRELCTCFPGDVLVIPCPISDVFKNYCLELIGLDAGSVTIIATPEPYLSPLATYFTGQEQFARLKAALCGDGFTLDCFAPDLPTIDLANALGIPLLGYDSQVPASAMAIYYLLNTKAGFKQIAKELGLPVLDGRYCASPESVYELARSGSLRHKQYKIKPNRGSNGFGHLTLGVAAHENNGLAEHVKQLFNGLADQPSGFVLEPFVPFVDSPSVEIHISRSGPMLTYTCSMRVPGGSFSGMLTPPGQEHAKMREQLDAYGLKFGEYLHRNDVFGFCDVDAGVTENGEMFLTETNLRKTGGTYLDLLMRRLVADDYERTHSWLADSHPLQNQMSFAGVLDRLVSEGLAYDASRKRGVVLTADTLQWDRRVRYLCIGHSASDALDQETLLRQHFQFAD